MKTVKLDLRLSVEEKEALKTRAKSEGLTVSEYVRNWIASDVMTDNSKVRKIEKDYQARNEVDNEFRSYFKNNKLNKPKK